MNFSGGRRGRKAQHKRIHRPTASITVTGGRGTPVGTATLAEATPEDYSAIDPRPNRDQ